MQPCRPRLVADSRGWRRVHVLLRQNVYAHEKLHRSSVVSPNTIATTVRLPTNGDVGVVAFRHLCTQPIPDHVEHADAHVAVRSMHITDWLNVMVIGTYDHQKHRRCSTYKGTMGTTSISATTTAAGAFGDTWVTFSQTPTRETLINHVHINIGLRPADRQHNRDDDDAQPHGQDDDHAANFACGSVPAHDIFQHHLPEAYARPWS